MKNCICFVVSMMTLLTMQSQMRAALVINSVVTSVDNLSSPTTSTVNVSLFGLYRNDQLPAPPAPENVSAFGVAVTINNVTPISISSATNAVGSQWSAFTNVLAPTVNLGAGTVTFQAYNSPDSTFTAITGTSAGASTLIGSFSFTVNKSNASQSFTTNASAATAYGEAGPPTGVGTGFVNFSMFGGFVNNVTNFNADPANVNNPVPVLGTGTITPTAVPEPSSLALLGLVSAGGYIARRRRAAKVS